MDIFYFLYLFSYHIFLLHLSFLFYYYFAVSIDSCKGVHKTLALRPICYLLLQFCLYPIIYI